MTNFDRKIVFVAFSIATLAILPLYWLLFRLAAWTYSRLDDVFYGRPDAAHLAYFARCRRRRVLQSESLARHLRSLAGKHHADR